MVDDSEDDCLLIRRAIWQHGSASFIGSVSDGEELVSFYLERMPMANRKRFPLPDMLLLDLKMPRKNGSKFWKWLQSQPFENMVVVDAFRF